MKGSAGHARWRILSRPRKKNGGNDPPGGHARSRSTVTRYLQRSSQDGRFGSGSRRNAGALGHAPGGRSSVERTAAIPSPDGRPADSALCLRPTGSIPGTALQARLDGRRQGGSSHVLTTCARSVTQVNFLPMSNWTSSTRNFLRECAACRRLWARRLHSIMAVNS